MKESLEQYVRRLQLSCHHPVHEILAGEYLSVFKGRGIEFEEVREYVLGDDVRAIDWNVTARTGHPYIKQYIEERELTLYLLVDASASCIAGPVGRVKRDAMAKLAALLAFSAVRNHDRVGLIQFTTEVEQFIPPGKGEAHIQFLLEEMLGFQPQQKQTDIAAALDHLERITRKRCIVFLLSDFQVSGFEESLQVMSRHHDLIAISVCDTHETELPDVGLIALRDNETGRQRAVDTHRSEVRQRLAELATERQQDLGRLFNDLWIDHLEVRTEDDYVHDLVEFFEMRKRRGRHATLG